MSNPSAFSANNNPFATEFTDRVPYRFQDGDWATHWDRLSELQFHSAIVGPKGTGKTTLLEALSKKLEDYFGAAHVVHQSVSRDLKDSRAFVASLVRDYQKGAILLVDSIERISFLQRRKLLRLRPCSHQTGQTERPRGIIVTCHSPCRLPTWVTTSGSMESLDHVINQLNALSNREFVLQRAKAALHSHNGNVRDAIRELYDRFAAGEFQRP